MNEITIALDVMRKVGKVLTSKVVDNTIEVAQGILVEGIKKVETIQLTREIVKEEIKKQFGD